MAKFEIIKGRLNQYILSDQRAGKWYKFSMIDIGERTLQKITAYKSIAELLTHTQGEDVELIMNGSAIVAVVRNDGKVYTTSIKKAGAFSWIIAFFLIGAYGLGLVLMAFLYIANKNIDKLREMVQGKGIIINLE